MHSTDCRCSCHSFLLPTQFHYFCLCHRLISFHRRIILQISVAFSLVPLNIGPGECCINATILYHEVEFRLVKISCCCYIQNCDAPSRSQNWLASVRKYINAIYTWWYDCMRFELCHQIKDDKEHPMICYYTLEIKQNWWWWCSEHVVASVPNRCFTLVVNRIGQRAQIITITFEDDRRNKKCHIHTK